MTVCYFTASGNCLYVAGRIGGTLLSIPQLMRQNEIVIEDDAVGVVCPVYNAEMPMMVREFMRKASIKTGYSERPSKITQIRSQIHMVYWWGSSPLMRKNMGCQAQSLMEFKKDEKTC